MIARNSRTFRRALLGASALVGLAFTAGQSQAQTLPSVNNAGGASISTTNGNTMDVNLNGASRVIDYISFSVSSDATVNFRAGVADNSRLTAVNRVIGGTASSIEGAINAEANVNVWLINPNGVVFGQTGSFNGGGLLVSTLDFNQTVDGAFRAAFAAPGASESTAFRFAGTSSSAIRFLSGSGQINAQGGIVAMAQQIDAGKTLTATGAITLIAGTDVTLSGGFADPLSFTINAGTTLGTAQVSVGGTLIGQSVRLAGDAQNAVTADLLNVTTDGQLTATASDGRIYITTSSALPAANAPGVRSQGKLTANGVNADVRMEAAGDLTAAGTITAGRDVSLTSYDDLAMAGTANAGRFVTLSSSGDITSAGNVAAGDAYVLTADGQITMGAAGQTLNQAAAGGVMAHSYTDNVIGLGALTLRSNTDGVGSEGVSLRADVGAVNFGSQTSVIGGTGSNRSEIVVTSAPTIRLGNVTGSNLRTAGSSSLVAPGDIVLGDVELENDLTVSSASGSVTAGSLSTAGPINVSAQNAISLGDVASNGGSLTVVSSVGDIVLGEATAADAVTLTAAQNIRLVSARAIGGDLTVTATSGAVSGTTLGTPATDGRPLTGYGRASLTASSDTRKVTLTAGGVAQLDVVSAGDGSTTLAGPQIDLTAAALDVGVMTAVNGDVSVDATGGNARIGSIYAYAVGGDVNVTSTGTTTLGRVSAQTGAVDLSGDALVLTGDVRGETVHLVAADGSITQTGGVITTPELTGSATQGAVLTAQNAIAVLGDFTAASLSLRDIDGLTVDGDVQVGLASGALDIRTTGGDLTLASGASLEGKSILLSTDEDFINQGGSGVLTLGTGGRWLVYSAGPTGNQFGGLNSGNTAVWNGTADTVTPAAGAGNRYVFAYQPTVSFTTQGGTKTYGDDLTGATASFYTVSGLQAGVTNAFLGDTAAMAFSGAPTITSSGLAARASVAGSPHAVNIAAGSAAGLNGYAVAVVNSGATITVTPKQVTGVAGTANNKTYDGTTAGSGALSLNGALSGDDVQATATFTFADEKAGVGKTVSLSNGALAGADAGNYVLMSIPATLMADILRRAITATASANDKTYDGTTAATGSLTLNGVIGNDDVTGSATFTFADENAGVDRTVSLSNGVLAGNDAGNYTLTLPTTTLADILRRAVTATASANDKTYDGTTAVTGSLTLNGVLGNDDVTGSATFTFADKNAGTDRTVSVSNGVLAGNDAGNYTLTLPTTTLADILRRAVTATANANDKTYDGTTAATGSLTLNGVLGNDDVTGSATFAFVDRNAGVDRTVLVSNGVLAGNDAGNYMLTLPSTTLADILRRSITATVNANDKTYDGTTAATGSLTLNGLVGNDDVTGAATFAFADKNAGVDKTVSLSNGILAGNDAGNYVLTLPTTTLADILRRTITATASANDKTYDGTTAATGSLTLNGVIGNDDVTGSATFTFADRNASVDKTVSLSNGVLAGNDAGNYTLTLSATTLADIFRRAITITAQDAAKTEGQQDPALHYAVTNGALIQGDAFTGALSRAPGEAPGVYAIGQGDLAASSNYQLTFNGAQLTIEPADTQAPANPIFDSFLISIGNAVVPVEKAITLVVENLDCEDSDCPVSEQ